VSTTTAVRMFAVQVQRMKSTHWVAAGAVWLTALGCGPPLPPTETAPDPIPPKAAPIAADPYEEVIYPERPSAAPESAAAVPENATVSPEPSAADPYEEYDKELLAALDAAEKKVLETGRQMALVDREVILGACWDYANTVYKRAGFPSNKRKTIFNRPKTGPYADPHLFQPGDFLSYSHDEKGEWVHSAIFVDWTNTAEHVARMLTYPGGSRPVPAYYSDYVLNRVFRVVRPKP
jgi:hypothetical protein